MHLASRLFRYVLLVSVLLNLGDAPYVDEIFDNLVPLSASGVAALTSPDDDTRVPASDHKPPATSVSYQLLAACLAVVESHDPLPALARLTGGSPAEYSFSFSSLPPGRIDRPPRYPRVA